MTALIVLVMMLKLRKNKNYFYGWSAMDSIRFMVFLFSAFLMDWFFIYIALKSMYDNLKI